MADDKRPSLWALTRSREIAVIALNAPGCLCLPPRSTCDTHWQIAKALDQAYFEGHSGVQH